MFCRIFGHWWKYKLFMQYNYRKCTICKKEQSSFLPRPIASRGEGWKDLTLEESKTLLKKLKRLS